ncbi:MAG TPA: cupredoxin domain-containing protein [Gemmatimonadaceae bacterium]|nr:cupredoxin domain-containing protein [Gemmatimonadaceae bacterium]
MKRTSGLLALVLPVVMATACTPAEERDIADTGALAVPPATTTTPAGTMPTDTGQAARTVHVVLNEWRVSPSEMTLAAGPVLFHVMNEGQYQHALQVQRGSDEWETGNVRAGGTGTVTVNLTPGTYTLYCPVADAQGNHRQMGMQTTITVR